MNVVIAASRTCRHRPVLERELSNWGVEYRVLYFEDHPELTAAHGIQTSPVVILDGDLAFVGMPELPELKRRLGVAGGN